MRKKTAVNVTENKITSTSDIACFNKGNIMNAYLFRSDKTQPTVLPTTAAALFGEEPDRVELKTFKYKGEAVSLFIECAFRKEALNVVCIPYPDNFLLDPPDPVLKRDFIETLNVFNFDSQKVSKMPLPDVLIFESPHTEGDFSCLPGVPKIVLSPARVGETPIDHIIKIASIHASKDA